MQDKEIGGRAKILGKWFSFPTNGGLGLVELDGKLALVRFSCPLESMPPQGSGDVVASTGVEFILDSGQLKYQGENVAFGSPE